MAILPGIDDQLQLENIPTEVHIGCMYRLELRSSAEGINQFVGTHQKNEHFERPDTVVCVTNDKSPHALTPKQYYNIMCCIRFANPTSGLKETLEKIWV
jgi:hypothetical protein